MQKLRNIAIIAHVDHGKTTLVDKMILAGHILRDNSKQTGELILDNNDLERERGITILSKNVSVIYKDYKINIIDTPGHADFGGEVERVLNMCDGVLLLVDAFEGTMPQTRFVLQKALALGKKPIVVVNKVDKPNCRPEVVNEQVFDLMFSLNATEEQLDYKTIYGSAKQGWMSHKWNERTDSIVPLLDAIIDEIPEPATVEGTPQLLITSLEYSAYTGRIAVGKLTRGTLRAGQNVTLAKRDGVTMQKCKIKELMVFEGLGKKKVEEVPCGEICAVMGVEGFEIGDTICDFENPEPLPPIAIDEPTMSMLFTINNSPFFGKDGKYVTSRHIKERLDRELEKNLALRVTPGPSVRCTMVQQIEHTPASTAVDPESLSPEYDILIASEQAASDPTAYWFKDERYDSSEWVLFPWEIVGFNFCPGYEAHIRIRPVAVYDPTKGDYRVQYRQVTLRSTELKDSEGLPTL